MSRKRHRACLQRIQVQQVRLTWENQRLPWITVVPHSTFTGFMPIARVSSNDVCTNHSIANVHAESGLKVCGVTPGSPADEAGVRQGDRIINVKGEAIDSIGRVSLSSPFAVSRVYNAEHHRVGQLVTRKDFGDVSYAFSFERSFCSTGGGPWKSLCNEAHEQSVYCWTSAREGSPRKSRCNEPHS